MGYISIIHLYKCKEFFTLFKDQQICAMEKIHGTSTHILLKHGDIKYHSGGETQKSFSGLFDKEFIFAELNAIMKEYAWSNIKVHGEAYGHKQQKMSATYGPKLKFIVFDIRVNTDTPGDHFLDVADAEKITHRLRLEFVPYEIGPNIPSWLEAQATKESAQAVRNGMGEGKLREGIVIRPLIEGKMSDGERAIFKHKNNTFWETKNPRSLEDQITTFSSSDDIVTEWVTDMRAQHVIDKILHNKEIKKIEKTDITLFVDNMLIDIKKESGGEIVWSDAVEKAIRRQAGQMARSLIDFTI